MTSLIEVQQAARATQDEHGEPVIQIPLKIWEAYMHEVKPAQSQKEQIEALLQQWENEPEKDMPEAWWDEFMAFLKANRFHLRERDLDFGEE